MDGLKAYEAKYAAAVSLWKDWNAKINVISRKDTDNIFLHHILHSLAIAEYVRRFGGVASETASLSLGPTTDVVPPLMMPRVAQVSEAMPPNHATRPKEQFTPTILDLGTGGGFPGIPLAVEWPDARFTLCDSIGKKVKVAQAVADGLSLGNVSCVHARAEELEGEWDYVVSRAVAPLGTLYGWVRGKFRRSLICLKGGDVNEEIAELLRRYAKGPHAVKASQVRVWPISDWLQDEYFSEKFVIEVGKTYLCSPLDEK